MTRRHTNPGPEFELERGTVQASWRVLLLVVAVVEILTSWTDASGIAEIIRAITGHTRP